MVRSQHPPFLSQLYNNTCGSGLSPFNLKAGAETHEPREGVWLLLISLTSNWFRNPDLGRSAQGLSQMAGNDLFRINSSMQSLGPPVYYMTLVHACPAYWPPCCFLNMLWGFLSELVPTHSNANSLISFKTWLKCHPLTETYSDHPI